VTNDDESPPTGGTVKRTEADTTYQPTAGRQHGRVAVVTGAAGGIGQAVARRLAAEGAMVTVADVQDGSETVELIEDAGGQAQAVACDLASPESVSELGAAVREAHGTCDILVNIAGIFPLGEFASMSFDTWRLMMSVNLDSLFHTCQEFLPGMVEQGWGRIVNTASDVCFGPAFCQRSSTAYAASKGGVIGFSRALAAEVGDSGVTVNILSPGLTRTPRSEQLGAVGQPNGDIVDLEAQRFDPITSQQAMTSTTVPSDHAAVVAFMVSEDAARMTGHTFQVDSGWLMNT
jgi:NAD(P)-dependent dehydrogenase (short-subunit alcohol dehydrogenase family)